MKFKFKLTKAARSQGGDRYETQVQGEAKPWVIYVPQSISRKGGSPREEVEVEIS